MSMKKQRTSNGSSKQNESSRSLMLMNHQTKILFWIANILSGINCFVLITFRKLLINLILYLMMYGGIFIYTYINHIFIDSSLVERRFSSFHNPFEETMVFLSKCTRGTVQCIHQRFLEDSGQYTHELVLSPYMLRTRNKLSIWQNHRNNLEKYKAIIDFSV